MSACFCLTRPKSARKRDFWQCQACKQWWRRFDGRWHLTGAPE